MTNLTARGPRPARARISYTSPPETKEDDDRVAMEEGSETEEDDDIMAMEEGRRRRRRSSFF